MTLPHNKFFFSPFWNNCFSAPFSFNFLLQLHHSQQTIWITNQLTPIPHFIKSKVVDSSVIFTATQLGARVALCDAAPAMANFKQPNSHSHEEFQFS